MASGSWTCRFRVGSGCREALSFIPSQEAPTPQWPPYGGPFVSGLFSLQQVWLRRTALHLTLARLLPGRHPWTACPGVGDHRPCDDFQRQRLLMHLTETAQGCHVPTPCARRLGAGCRSSGSCARAVRPCAICLRRRAKEPCSTPLRCWPVD